MLLTLLVYKHLLVVSTDNLGSDFIKVHLTNSGYSTTTGGVSLDDLQLLKGVQAVSDKTSSSLGESVLKDTTAGSTSIPLGQITKTGSLAKVDLAGDGGCLMALDT